MRRRLVMIAAGLLTGCATVEPGTSLDPPPWAPVGGVSKVQIEGRTLHYANLLGLPRARIEQGLPPGQPKRSSRFPGWVEYGDDLEIEYSRDVAVRLRARVPLTIQARCFEAAAWMGFSRPRSPFLDGPRCVWPGARLTHRLEKGYGGELNRDNRWFLIWLVDPFSPVA